MNKNIIYKCLYKTGAKKIVDSPNLQNLGNKKRSLSRNAQMNQLITHNICSEEKKIMKNISIMNKK